MPKTINIPLPAYGKGMMGTVHIDLSEECFSCVHLDRELPIYCKAWPRKDKEGIPGEIGSGKVSHTKPFKGDNGIRFEKEK